jgi:hypothetical protein
LAPLRNMLRNGFFFVQGLAIITSLSSGRGCVDSGDGMVLSLCSQGRDISEKLAGCAVYW